MKYFYDCEFLDDGRLISLISIGIVAEDGREYYAVSSDSPVDRISKHPWLLKNVVPSLPLTAESRRSVQGANTTYPAMVMLDAAGVRVKPKWVIANEVKEFLLSRGNPELWAYYGAYDHVALAQLWGPMVSLPKGIPFRSRELMELWEASGKPDKPVQVGEHDALMDARWNRDLYQVCVNGRLR